MVGLLTTRAYILRRRVKSAVNMAYDVANSGRVASEQFPALWSYLGRLERAEKYLRQRKIRGATQ